MGLKLAFVLIMSIFIRTDMMNSSNKLTLISKDKKIQINEKENNAIINLELINNTDTSFIIYRFTNKWWSLFENEMDCYTWIPGINLVIRDSQGNFIPENMVADDNDPEIMNALIEGKHDSIKQVLKKKFGDTTFWAKQDEFVKEEVIQSEIELNRNQAAKIQLDIDFDNFTLKKGEYSMYIYYVQNEQIFEFIDHTVKNELYMGCVKSNRVRLIVK